MDDNCLFCKIIKEEIPSYKFWEDETTIGFLDINPMQEGHSLIIPKKHYEELFEINEEEYNKIMLSVKKAASLLKKVFKSKRIGVVVEGFEINHAHIHLIPINKHEDFDLRLCKRASDDELRKAYEKIINYKKAGDD